MENLTNKIKKWFERQRKEKIAACIIVAALLLLGPFLTYIREAYYEALQRDIPQRKEKIDKSGSVSDNILNVIKGIEDISNEYERLRTFEIEGKDMIPKRDAEKDKDEALDAVVDQK